MEVLDFADLDSVDFEQLVVVATEVGVESVIEVVVETEVEYCLKQGYFGCFELLMTWQ